MSSWSGKSARGCAWGPARAEIVVFVGGRALRSALAGVALGLAAALALTQVLASLLFGVGPTDPATFAFVPTLVLVIALLASYMPARRAVNVDPVSAIRAE